MKTKTIYNSLLEVKLTLYRDVKSLNQLESHLRKKHDDSPDFHFPDPMGCYFVFFTPEDDSDKRGVVCHVHLAFFNDYQYYLDTLVHESSHAADLFIKYLYLDTESSGTELRAKMTEWVFRECCEFIEIDNVVR